MLFFKLVCYFLLLSVQNILETLVLANQALALINLVIFFLCTLEYDWFFVHISSVLFHAFSNYELSRCPPVLTAVVACFIIGAICFTWALMECLDRKTIITAKKWGFWRWREIEPEQAQWLAQKDLLSYSWRSSISENFANIGWSFFGVLEETFQNMSLSYPVIKNLS